MKNRKIIFCAKLLILSCLGLQQAQATTVFTTYTPPTAWGGYSSPRNGIATLISVENDTVINGISIRNKMLSDGQLKFVILDEATRDFLYISEPKQFSADITLTWKQSDSFSFEMIGGKSYFVGYMRSVAAEDYVDNIQESYNGFTSELSVASLKDYFDPEFTHVVFRGVDQAVRISVPEPATIALFAFGGLLLSKRKWKNKQIQKR